VGNLTVESLPTRIQVYTEKESLLNNNIDCGASQMSSLSDKYPLRLFVFVTDMHCQNSELDENLIYIRRRTSVSY
jgi:hypothetical protein